MHAYICFGVIFQQTCLEQNEGPGVQHIALKTNDMINTMRQMYSQSKYGGFEFQATPSAGYYKRAKERITVCVGTSSWGLQHLVLKYGLA